MCTLSVKYAYLAHENVLRKYLKKTCLMWTKHEEKTKKNKSKFFIQQPLRLNKP